MSEDFDKVIDSLKKLDFQDYDQETLEDNYFNDQYLCPERMSNWIDKFKSDDFVKIPKTVIVPVPRDVVMAFFFDHHDKDEKTIKEWIEKLFIPVLKKDFQDDKVVFIKNGCFSNKFDFDRSCKLDKFDVDTIYDHMCSIEEMSLMNDIMGDVEFAIREYIDPDPNIPTIYNGMALRPEMRLFYDFSKHELRYYALYWDYDMMTNGLRDEDLETFKRWWATLEEEYEIMVRKDLPNMVNWLDHNGEGLEDVLSVDFMKNGDDIYMIDIARGFRSAYWDPIRAYGIHK